MDGGGRAMVLSNFQCRINILSLLIVGQIPTVCAVGASGIVWGFFSFVCHFSFISPSL